MSHGCVAVHPRLGRAGLGNMLFPWARAVALAASDGMELMKPHWWRPRLGPYLRHEPDKRQYQRYLIQPSLSYVARSHVRLQMATTIDENGRVLRRGRSAERIMIVDGMGEFFAPLMAQQHAVASAFWQMVDRRRRFVAQLSEPCIAFHVRLGDFKWMYGQGGRNHATPIVWFAAQAAELRRLMPGHAVLVCSDGADHELADLMRVPGVRRAGGRTPIDHLVVLASADLIVGSGSTFSAWGAFLGQRPLLTEPGRNHYLKASHLAREVDLVSPEDLQCLGVS